MHNPKLIILDEPTNGLDPQGIADIRNLIRHRSKDLNKTILVSSHLLNEIEQIATRVLIIDKGKKLVEGSAAELFDPAQTLIELETLDNESAYHKLLQSKWSPALQPRRSNTILIKLHRDHIPNLHRELVALDISVLSLQPKHSLEDFFFYLEL